MEEERDHDLLVITSIKEEPGSRNKAFSLFCKRYEAFLWNLIEGVCKYHPNSYELSRAVYSNTIINVYNYSGSFSVDDKLSDKAIKKKIQNWLISIAKREFKNLVSSTYEHFDPSDLADSLKDDEADLKIENFMEKEESEELTFNEELVKAALEQLSRERDRHILMVYFQHYEKGVGDQAKNLDPRVRKELADKYQTTEANIRQIISRSKKIVFDYLKRNYKL
jgi:RNA polymerase sigma factor (sigma-70 family)